MLQDRSEGGVVVAKSGGNEPLFILEMSTKDLPTMQAAEDTRIIAVANLLETGAYSDVIIRSSDKDYQVHKAIVLPRVLSSQSLVERWQSEVCDFS